MASAAKIIQTSTKIKHLHIANKNQHGVEAEEHFPDVEVLLLSDRLDVNQNV